MESRLRIFLLKLLCALVLAGVLPGCSYLRVDDAPNDDTGPVISPELERRTITEDFFAEAAIGRTKAGDTSFETLSGGAQVLTDSQRKLTYYNISLGYNILPGEAFIGKGHAFNSALYLIAGVGNTEFADDSHFTVNVGAGYRFLVNDGVALHVDFRDHIFKSDLLGNDKTTHNLEGTAGISFFF